MCGTAIHKAEHGHGHPQHLFRVPAAHAAAYEYLVKENKAHSTTNPKKPDDLLTAFARNIFEKCSSFFGELKKSPAYKWAQYLLISLI